MGLLLGFMPLIVFCSIARLSVSLALWISFGTAFALGLQWFVANGALRLLDTAGIVLFGALAFYDGFVEPGTSVQTVSMIVEAAFLLVALWSLIVGRPLAGQYLSRHQGQTPVPIAGWVCYVLTGVWAAAFALMAASDGAILFIPAVRPLQATIAGLTALAGALAFTWLSGIYIAKQQR